MASSVEIGGRSRGAALRGGRPLFLRLGGAALGPPSRKIFGAYRRRRCLQIVKLLVNSFLCQDDIVISNNMSTFENTGKLNICCLASCIEGGLGLEQTMSAVTFNWLHRVQS